MTELTAEELRGVAGGDNSFGRCGPGDRMPWLGNVYTPECAAHDQSVREARARGRSSVGAQLEALPKFPAAVGSYVKKRFG
jgi:hypothetical protein